MGPSGRPKPSNGVVHRQGEAAAIAPLVGSQAPRSADQALVRAGQLARCAPSLLADSPWEAVYCLAIPYPLCRGHNWCGLAVQRTPSECCLRNKCEPNFTKFRQSCLSQGSRGSFVAQGLFGCCGIARICGKMNSSSVKPEAQAKNTADPSSLALRASTPATPLGILRRKMPAVEGRKKRVRINAKRRQSLVYGVPRTRY